MVKKSGILETYDYLTDGNGCIIGEISYKFMGVKSHKFFRFDTRYLKRFITLASKDSRFVDVCIVPYKTNKNVALLCASIKNDKKKVYALAGVSKSECD